MAPEIDLVASNGTRVCLKELRGEKKVVLYFYPRDFTSVCTKETCGFRDMLATFHNGDVLVVGVSTDSNESHQRFAAEYEIPFPLLADTDRAICKAYGAISGIRSLLGVAQRVTYVIGKDGKIASATAAEFSADHHLGAVKEALARLP
jgi:peroxiredoxin Q/BCP